MIQISEIHDKELLDKLNRLLHGDGDLALDRCFALLSEGDEGLGILRLEKGRVRIAFAAVTGQDARLEDLLIRSMLNVLADMKNIVVVAPCKAYYKAFGFEEKQGQMTVLSDRIVFPKSCGGKTC